MKLIGMQLDEYLAMVSSDIPAPGGGSASALCGSQGIALVAMAAKLTVKNGQYAADHPICQSVIKAADSLSLKLAGQIDLDTIAYSRIAASFKLPKETDAQKSTRRAAINEALRYAAEVPLETMRLGMRGLECAAKLIGHYNTSCASDVGCGIYGLLSCIQGAWLNVQINISSLPDGEITQALRAEGKALSARAEAMAAEMAEQIEACIS